jgi:hypothetical protein
VDSCRQKVADPQFLWRLKVVDSPFICLGGPSVLQFFRSVRKPTIGPPVGAVADPTVSKRSLVLKVRGGRAMVSD